MTLLYFLTLFPLVPALGMLLARGDRARDAVGLIGSGIIMAVTVVVAVMFFGTGPQSFEVAPGTSHVLSIISSVIDVILCAILPDCVHLVKGGLQRQTALHREDSLSPSLKRGKTLSIGKERQLLAEKRAETHAGDLPEFFQAIVQ